MEDRDDELPVATVRPRRLLGRLSAARGAIARWFRVKVRRTISGRHGVLLLTGVFFSGMMVCMGYVAEHANRAADGIDEAQRAQRAGRLLTNVVDTWTAEDQEQPAEEAASPPLARDHVLFYIVNHER